MNVKLPIFENKIFKWYVIAYQEENPSYLSVLVSTDLDHTETVWGAAVDPNKGIVLANIGKPDMLVIKEMLRKMKT